MGKCQFQNAPKQVHVIELHQLSALGQIEFLNDVKIRCFYNLIDASYNLKLAAAH